MEKRVIQEIWVWIRLPLRVVNSAIDALKEASRRAHWQAHQEDDDATRASILRAQGDRHDADAEEIKQALREDEKK